MIEKIYLYRVSWQRGRNDTLMSQKIHSEAYRTPEAANNRVQELKKDPYNIRIFTARFTYDKIPDKRERP